MKPSLVTSVHFSSEDALQDFLSSQEFTAVEIRDELMGRLRAGEGLVAIVSGEAPRALVLRSKLVPSTNGIPEGDDLMVVNFA